MDFGDAIRALKQGKRVTRRGWNGRGMFLYLKPATMVKAEWCHDPELKSLCEANGGELLALGTICMYTHDSTGRNAILTGWLASQVDILAEDWEIYIGDELLWVTIEQIMDRVDCEKILDKNFRSKVVQTLHHRIRVMHGFYVTHERVEKTALEIADKKYHEAMEKI